MDPDRETRLWYRQPARGWLEALPLGNGTIGAMLWGAPKRERVDLNIDTLWSGGPRTAYAENSKALLAALRAGKPVGEALEALLESDAMGEDASALAVSVQNWFAEWARMGWLTIGGA